jgi:hypothetical protein
VPRAQATATCLAVQPESIAGTRATARARTQRRRFTFTTVAPVETWGNQIVSRATARTGWSSRTTGSADRARPAAYGRRG